ncbi:hypothetical protein ACHHYP_14654 [Achlya hypogyna]|uniref:Uncharacterized protein n=1 Tax=Achlya hypogyna TaxID=1202772 RepID=A0A1V9YCQ8_ACHHY|nr:hypothetical protein ACHHYP_14654 [Achlya hypogyna]
MADGKPRLNPMELKRQRLAKRQKTEAPQGTVAPAMIAPPTEPAVSESSAGDLEAKMNAIYAKTRIDPNAMRNALGVQFPTTLKTHGPLPLDWTLKSKLAVMTSFPFPPRLRAAAATRSFDHFHRAANDDLEATELWHAALHQYIHPAAGLPNQADSVPDEDFVGQRLRVWQDALRSLYYSFHHSPQHTSFYLVTPQFVVCFYRRPVDASAASFRPLYSLPAAPSPSPPSTRRHGIAAVISHSTSSFRRELVANGIQFATPFSRDDGHALVKGDAALLKELQVLSKVDATLKRSQFSSPTPAAPATTAKSMRGADSLLLFHDPDHVHGLFDLLLNQQPTGALDVPTLLATFPFQHATTVPLRVTTRGAVRSSHTADLYKTDVEGIVLPETVRRLTRAVTSAAPTDDATVAIHPETWAASARLNVCGFDAATGLDLTAWLPEHADELELMKRSVTEVQWSAKSGYTVVVAKAAK